MPSWRWRANYSRGAGCRHGAGRDAVERTTGARLGEVGIFKGYRNVSIFFTTNVTTPYSIGYQDLTNGPLVIDLPPGAVAGSINDFWQRAITDLGFTGPDQGKGGKYVCA
jgi:hypothetical protein